MEVDNEGNEVDGKSTSSLIELKTENSIGDDLLKEFAIKFLMKEKLSKNVFYSRHTLLKEAEKCVAEESVYNSEFLVWLKGISFSRCETRRRKEVPLRNYFDSIKFQCHERNYPAMLRSRLREVSYQEFCKYVVCVEESGVNKFYLTSEGLKEKENYLSAFYTTTKIPNVAKILSLMSCEKEDRTEEIFADSDIFLLFNESRVKEYTPTVEYFDYINSNYTIDQRVDLLKNYYARMCRKDSEDWDYDSYSSNFYHQSVDQTHLYDSLLVPGYKYVIHSDGLGIMSMIAISKGIQYVSSEPNRIGYLAKSLGIITADRFMDDYPDHIHLYLYCYKYYRELPKFRGQMYLVFDNEITEFPGERISPEASGLNLDVKYLSRIKKDYFKNDKPPFVITNAYPLDAPSSLMLSNMNIPQRPPDTAQYLVAMDKDVLSSHSVYSKQRWSNVPKSKWSSFVKGLRHKTALLPGLIFPYRGENFVWDKGRDYLLDRRNQFESSFSFFLEVPYKEEYVDSYTRNGNFFLFMKKHSNNVTRYIRLNKEDQVRFKSAVIRVYLVSTIIVKDRRYQVYVHEEESSRDHPFVMLDVKL